MAFDFIARAAAKGAQSAVSPFIWRQRPSLVTGRTQGTATENAARLQIQINALSAAGGGTLRIVEDVIQLDRPLLVPRGVSIVGPGKNRCLIQNTFVPTSGFSSYYQSALFMPGNFHPAYTQALAGQANSKALAAITAGDMAITLSTAGDAAGYAVGDIIVVFDNLFYTSTYKIFQYLALRRVMAISGGTITLDEPLRDSVAAGSAYNLRTGTILGHDATVSGVNTKLFAWGDGEISGFSTDTPGHMIGDSAVWKGLFADIEVRRGRSLWYGNCYQQTIWDGVGGRFMVGGGEQSHNSEGNEVRNFRASYDAGAAAAYGGGFSSAISMQENGMDITYRSGLIDVTGAPGGNVIQIINFQRPRVVDVELRHNGTAFSGTPISINNASAAGKREPTDGQFDVRWRGPCGRYVWLQNSATAGHVISGDFRGTPSNEAFFINGPTGRNVIARTAMFEQGVGKFGAGTAAQEVVGCYVGGGMAALTTTDYSTLTTNNVREVRTAKSAPRRGASASIAAAYNQTGTTAETVVLTAPCGLASLQRQDVIEFTMRVNVTGTAGIKTIKVNVVDNTTPATFTPVTFTIPAATTGVIELTGKIHVSATNQIFSEASSGNSAVTIAKASIGTDLGAKDVSITITGTLVAAADVLNFGVAKTTLTNPVQN